MKTLSESNSVVYQGQLFNRINGGSRFEKVRWSTKRAQAAYPLNSAIAHVRWSGMDTFLLISEDCRKA